MFWTSKYFRILEKRPRQLEGQRAGWISTWRLYPDTNLQRLSLLAFLEEVSTQLAKLFQQVSKVWWISAVLENPIAIIYNNDDDGYCAVAVLDSISPLAHSSAYQENTMNITTWHYHRTPTLTCSPLCVWAHIASLHTSCLQRRSLYTCVRGGGTFCDLSSIQMECHSVF